MSYESALDDRCAQGLGGLGGVSGTVDGATGRTEPIHMFAPITRETTHGYVRRAHDDLVSVRPDARKL
jgi:hypothetical protein